MNKNFDKYEVIACGMIILVSAIILSVGIYQTDIIICIIGSIGIVGSIIDSIRHEKWLESEEDEL